MRGRYVYLLSLVATLFLVEIGHAQSVDQWTTWGDAAFAKGEYYGASRFYGGALAMQPGRMALQWKQAEAMRLSNQYDKAHELYGVVFRKDQGRTFPDALRWQGEMLLSDGQYDEARDVWEKVLRKEKDRTSITAKRAVNALAGIELANVPDTGHIEIEHLPEPINSYSSEFGAQNGPDGLLYYTTLRGELNKDGEVKDTAAYHATIVNADAATGSEPQPLPAPLNTDLDFANTTWSPDGKTLLFTRCAAQELCAIWSANVIYGAYTDLKPVQGLPDNATNTQPMLVKAGDEVSLFFASDASGGTGGMDIWRATFVDGVAKHPIPLGEPVNTPGNERTPWVSSTEEKLWYSSDFLPGFGGYDIFTSTFGNNAYAAPINVGKPWNSPANDLYPTFDPRTSEAFLTSNRKGSLAAKGETCCNDIYRIRSAQLTPTAPLTIADTVSTIAVEIPNEPQYEQLRDLQARFPLKLYFHNDEPEPRSWVTTTEQTYGNTYAAYKKLVPEYGNKGNDRDAVMHFFKDEVDYGFDQLQLLVDAMIPLLATGEQITLDVRGHASPLARNDYNQNLSQRRIESLRNQFIVANNGALGPFLDSSATTGGILRISVLPFGEDRSATSVSDDLRDLTNSVYSVAAARERRIEVQRIGVEERTMEDPNTIHYSIGTVKQGVEERFELTIPNRDQKPLTISTANSECDCVHVGELPGSIAPGANGKLELIYTGRTRPGPLERRITLTTNEGSGTIELIIDGTVIE